MLYTITREDLDGKPLYIVPVSKKQAAAYLIPVQDEIQVEKDGVIKTQVIRYAPTESSILVEDQSDLASLRLGNIRIGDKGITAINKQDTNLFQFIMSCNYNESNPNRNTSKRALFRILIPGEEDVSFIEKDRVITKLKNQIYDADIATLRTFLSVHGHDTSEWKPESLLSKTLQYATDKPETWTDVTNNPRQYKIKFDMQEAMIKKIIVKNANVVSWADGNTIMQSESLGVDVLDKLSDYLVTKQGAETYNELVSRLYGKPKEGTPVNHIGEQGPEVLAKALIEKGLDKKVLTREGQALFYGKGRNKEMIGKNAKEAVKNLLGNPILYDNLVSLVRE